jgi:hypothetical protein
MQISDTIASFVADPHNRAVVRRAHRTTGHHDFAIRLYSYGPLKGEVKPWLIDPLRTIAILLDANPNLHEPGINPGLFVRQLFPKDYGKEFETVCRRLARSTRETACVQLERKQDLARYATVDIERLYNDLKFWTNGARCTALQWVIQAAAAEETV